eukprot:CAMPEP_0185535592 /NCGR_PEP_ID=MMETSP1366-20130426/109523_1 /TAXON_ID=38817 /ORGANISM="Gephyrocapsa oceanica, Strain RCC1303" /LENGTH=280 /DNA_ID=CAMNT_0028147313 /DNA_START=222 /DNA_END=1063 /DNA_ORIENTATION=+
MEPSSRELEHLSRQLEEAARSSLKPQHARLRSAHVSEAATNVPHHLGGPARHRLQPAAPLGSEQSVCAARVALRVRKRRRANERQQLGVADEDLTEAKPEGCPRCCGVCGRWSAERTEPLSERRRTPLSIAQHLIDEPAPLGREKSRRRRAAAEPCQSARGRRGSAGHRQERCVDVDVEELEEAARSSLNATASSPAIHMRWALHLQQCLQQVNVQRKHEEELVQKLIMENSQLRQSMGMPPAALPPGILQGPSPVAAVLPGATIAPAAAPAEPFQAYAA